MFISNYLEGVLSLRWSQELSHSSQEDRIRFPLNRTESVHRTLRFLFLSHLCENLHYESVYFKELHNDQEYY